MTPIQIANLALLKIGQSKGITALNEASRAAWTAQQVYDHHLRATLRAFPWPFATKYLELTLVQGPDPTWEDPIVQAWDATLTYEIGDVVEDGDVLYVATAQSLNQAPPNASYWSTTITEDANGDWRYAYRWPTDCLFARRIVPAGGDGRSYHPTPIPFRVGRDTRGQLIYTNEPQAVVEYTAIDCDNMFTDDLFIVAFAWHLGHAMAPSLSRDERMAEKAYAMFLATLDTAKAVGSMEQQLPDGGPAGYDADR